MKNGKCPKCDSHKIVPAVSIGHVAPMVDGTLSIKYSDVWDRKSVTAYVCGDCGYTELYVEKPQVVWENYNKSRKGTKE